MHQIGIYVRRRLHLKINIKYQESNASYYNNESDAYGTAP